MIDGVEVFLNTQNCNGLIFIFIAFMYLYIHLSVNSFCDGKK